MTADDHPPVPCCDYRDHEVVCACPDHPPSSLHIFGTQGPAHNDAPRLLAESGQTTQHEPAHPPYNDSKVERASAHNDAATKGRDQ